MQAVWTMMMCQGCQFRKREATQDSASVDGLCRATLLSAFNQTYNTPCEVTGLWCSVNGYVEHVKSTLPDQPENPATPFIKGGGKVDQLGLFTTAAPGISISNLAFTHPKNQWLMTHLKQDQVRDVCASAACRSCGRVLFSFPFFHFLSCQFNRLTKVGQL